MIPTQTIKYDKFFDEFEKLVSDSQPAPKITLPKIVVVGNGMVCHRFCQTLIALGGEKYYQVIVFGEEAHPAYDRIKLTECFTGKSTKDLILSPKEWYEQHKIQLYLDDPVTDIDTSTKTILSAKGRIFRYEYLVFATGSSTFIPPILGAQQPGIFEYRTIDDLELIKIYSKSSQRAAVIGGGLLGLEAARALKELGLETHIIEYAANLMPQQLDKEAAAVLQRDVENQGIVVHLKRLTESIESRGSERILHFDNKDRLAVDLVVVSAGVRPRDTLAAQCGIVTRNGGGIAVNDLLQTSDSNIFAMGECAAHNDTVYGLVRPGYQMADVLANNFMGNRGRFLSGDTSTRLKMMGTDVAVLGNYLKDGQVVNYTSSDTFRQLVIHRGKLVGAIGVGEWPALAQVQDVIRRKKYLFQWNLRRFEKNGNLEQDDFRQSHSALSWPSTTVVCNCMQVNVGTLKNACTEGCITVEALSQKTGAGSICGSCKPLLADFTNENVEETSKRSYGLLISSFVAFLMALGFLLSPPIPHTDSVQGMQWDFLWRDGFWKQVSGYAMLGCAGLTTLLSFRKRIKWLTVGPYWLWRTLHGVFGGLILFFAILHTGLHLGSNLNFLLMMDFLILAFLGGASGKLITLLKENSSFKRILQTQVTRLHIYAAWPFPILLFFHILSVYYF